MQIISLDKHTHGAGNTGITTTTTMTITTTTTAMSDMKPASYYGGPTHIQQLGHDCHEVHQRLVANAAINSRVQVVRGAADLSLPILRAQKTHAKTQVKPRGCTRSHCFDGPSMTTSVKACTAALSTHTEQW